MYLTKCANQKPVRYILHYGSVINIFRVILKDCRILRTVIHKRNEHPAQKGVIVTCMSWVVVGRWEGLISRLSQGTAVRHIFIYVAYLLLNVSCKLITICVLTALISGNQDVVAIISFRHQANFVRYIVDIYILEQITKILRQGLVGVCLIIYINT